MNSSNNSLLHPSIKQFTRCYKRKAVIEMPQFTAAQKQKLIERFELQTQQKRAALTKELQNVSTIFEAKISRRLAMVPKKFAQLRIKDVLTVERDHKIKIYELIKDIEQMQQKEQKEQKPGHSDTEIREQLALLKKKKQENVRILQKRKESMAMGGGASGRVSKPPKSTKAVRKQ